MASKIDICNLALSHIGSGEITSLEDGTQQSSVLGLHYNNCLEMALEIFPWNFCQRIDVLALSTKTVPGWQFVYQYPANCLKVWKVYDAGGYKSDKTNEFRIISDGINKFVCCRLPEAYAEYSARVNDSSMYSASFVKALSYLLAAEIVNPLNGNAQKAAEMMQKYQLSVAEAQLSSAVEGIKQPSWTSKYVVGRG